MSKTKELISDIHNALSDIKEIEDQMRKLSQQKRNVENLIQSRKRHLLHEATGLKIGITIEMQRAKKAVRMQIISLRMNTKYEWKAERPLANIARVTCVLYNKDGKIGRRTRQMWYSELERAKIIEPLNE